MKMNKDLVSTPLNQKATDDFKAFVKNLIKIKKLKGLRKFILSKLAWFLCAIIAAAGIAVYIYATLQDEPMPLSGIGFSIVFVSLLCVFVILKCRKKHASNPIEELDFLKITQEWFKNYKIEKNQIHETTVRPEHIELISNMKKAPDGATTKNKLKAFVVQDGHIKITFVVVLGKGVNDSFANGGFFSKKVLSVYEHEGQTYIFEEGFNEKGKGFNFSLNKEQEAFTKKRESLENPNFNKLFNYTHNDALRLRQLFTVATQEQLVNKFQGQDINIAKADEIMTTTYFRGNSKKSVAPFHVNIKGYDKNVDKIKQKVADEATKNYETLMKFIWHARLLSNIYK